MSRFLPSRLPGHLLRLRHVYDRSGKTTLRDVLDAASAAVEEDAEYDNWNGGTYGHDVHLFLPLDDIVKVDMQGQAAVAEEILEGLSRMSGATQNEYYRAVHVEMANDTDPLFQKSSPLSSRPPVDPASVSFWKPGLARLFVSHRDAHKADARRLGEALEGFGFSCFVAHDTIQPLSEWRHEIMKGLETMEVMLVYLTDDFPESSWTNQEVGFALDKGVPIISLKLGTRDPPGFISHVQAKRGAKDRPEHDAAALFPLIGQVLGSVDLLYDALVGACCATPNWNEARERFDRLSEMVPTLTEEQAGRIKEAFYANDQLHGATYLVNQRARLVSYMQKATGARYEVAQRRLVRLGPARTELDDEIPF